MTWVAESHRAPAPLDTSETLFGERDTTYSVVDCKDPIAFASAHKADYGSGDDFAFCSQSFYCNF